VIYSVRNQLRYSDSLGKLVLNVIIIVATFGTCGKFQLTVNMDVFSCFCSVKAVLKDEPKYYEDVVAYSKNKLMLYPYHLSDRIDKGLRITPFQYYISIIEKIMEQEKSYDSLPNFTAADCKFLIF